MISLIVADDHKIFREGLLRMLASACHIRVIGDAGDGESTFQLIKNEKPDVAVIDISMPGMDGLQIIEKLREHDGINTKIILLTMHNSAALASRAIKLGAAGYLLKDNTFRDLIYAVETVKAGKKFISTDISEKLLCDNHGDKADKLLLLTAREKEILRQIALGQKNRDIAGELCISIKTVASHRTNIMEKLGLHSVADLVRYAVQSGLI